MVFSKAYDTLEEHERNSAKERKDRKLQREKKMEYY
jgi:hypothetical protein